MHPFPHRYTVTATNQGTSEVTLSSGGLPSFVSTAPVEFDGPGGHWSPETLLVAAVADCFMLTFRAIARMSHLEWSTLSCEVSGAVDRVDGVTQFTAFDLQATLVVPATASDAEVAKSTRLMHKAHDGCLVSNSMKGTRHLSVRVDRAASV